MVDRKDELATTGAPTVWSNRSRPTCVTTWACWSEVRRQGPDLYENGRGHSEYRQSSQGRSEGLQEKDEGTGIRGLGRLPGHDYFPGHSLGRQPTSARRESLPRSQLPSLTSSAPTPAPPAPGSAVRKTWLRKNTSGVMNICPPVKGLFCCGDASGASSHKFSSGSHAEGRCGRQVDGAFRVENNTQPNVDAAKVEALKKKILNPMDLFADIRSQVKRSGHQPRVHETQNVHVPSPEDHG